MQDLVLMGKLNNQLQDNFVSVMNMLNEMI